MTNGKSFGGTGLCPGAESRASVQMAPHVPDLRARGRDHWAAFLRRCGARILSEVRTEACDAYLLSESSMFVWADRFSIITCGHTRLVDALEPLLAAEAHQITGLRYQRRNDPERDLCRLQALLPAALHTHRNARGGVEQELVYGDVAPITTMQLYRLGPDARARFTGAARAAEIRAWLQAAGLLEGSVIDEFFFSPCGYSINGLRGGRYWTLHVTPEDDICYASAETDLDDVGWMAALPAWMGAEAVQGPWLR